MLCPALGIEADSPQCSEDLQRIARPEAGFERGGERPKIVKTVIDGRKLIGLFSELQAHNKGYGVGVNAPAEGVKSTHFMRNF